MTETEYLVFSTSIRDEKDVNVTAAVLKNMSFIRDWSIDLDNWENVLRIEIEGMHLHPSTIKKALREKGVMIREMPME